MSLECITCKEQKPESAFSKRNDVSRGYSYKCKTCHNAYCREVWYKKNKSKQLASTNKWKQDNKAKLQAAKYGITVEEAETLLSVGKCQLCPNTKGLCIDHDHVTGKVRGVLCFHCNSSIGKLGDSVEGLTKALNYLLDGR